VRRGVLTTLTAAILLFSSFTFSSCKACNKEDKGKESIGGDGNADDKPSDKGGSPALSAEEKKEDIVRKRTVALDSIKAAKKLAQAVSDEINKAPRVIMNSIMDGMLGTKSVELDAEEKWVRSIEHDICDFNSCCWYAMVVIISRVYVSRNDYYRTHHYKDDYEDDYEIVDAYNSKSKDGFEQQCKEYQEKSKDLYKQADAHIKNIRRYQYRH
jgi:hypothetical protein